MRFILVMSALLCTTLLPAGEPLKIGQVCALEGPAKGLGQGMNLGLRAAIAESNAAGGVHGRQLVLIAQDDGYDPDRSIDATSRLIDAEKVFCLAGFVGTPTAKAAIPLAAEAGVPVVGLFTGAMFLREPPQRLVFNIRASYDDETEVLVEHLTGSLAAKRIAVFHQNDSFGLAGLSGTTKALKKRSLDVAAAGTFERNTVAVQKGLAAMVEAKPDAIIMVGPYKPLSAFVREARAAGLTCPLATISFVGTESLIGELAAAADGLIISQVVPSPLDVSLPVVKAYQAAQARIQAEAKPSYVALEGYITGRVLLAGLAKAGPDPDRNRFVAGLEAISALDLGGFGIAFAADRRQASSRVWLTRVAGGVANSIDTKK